VLLKHSKAENAGWMVITAGWGFAVMSGVFVAQATGSPGAAINPAVTVAVMVQGNLGPVDGAIQIAGQFIGAFIGAVLVWLHYLPHWGATDDPGLKLATFSTAPAIRNTGTNIISEIIGTFVLVFVVFAIFGVGLTGVVPEQIDAFSLSQNLYPYLVGVLVWGIGLSLGGPTGYAINPARDLGPRIAHAVLPIPGKGGSDWGYSWIPVVGPIIGASIAAVVGMSTM
jgi:glycerol uptake facilitator protein